MVYITSDLFGPPTTHGRGHDHDHPHSPIHSYGLGKRKRQTGDDTRANPCGRESTRSQGHANQSSDANESLSYAVYATAQHASAAERRPMKQSKRNPPKAVLVKSTSHLMDVERDLSQPSHTPHAVADLRPCHACLFAPKRKRDLENYLECRRCDQRTCYICARQCIGGCGKAICKKCTVEVGQEGDSWCLDCFSRNLNS